MNGAPLRRKVTITNPQGLHMRPMSALVELASRYQSSVRLYRPQDPQPYDGKSMISLLGLAAVQGTELTVEVAGVDQEAALEAIINLLANPNEPGSRSPPNNS